MMNREEAIYKAMHLRKVHPNICVDAEDFWETVIAALDQEPCDDAISRQDLIEPRFIIAENDYQKGWNDALDSVYENAPSVTPAEKVGRWNPYDGSWYECSECGAIREAVGYFENFCPNCGARMQEVKE